MMISPQCTTPSCPWGLPVAGVRLFGASFILTFALVAFAQGQDAAQLFQDALEAQQRGDSALAVSKYENLLGLHPDMVAARVNLGGVLVSLRRFDDAIGQYRAALQQTPGDHDLRLKLGLAYFKKQDYAQAAGEFDALHETDPGNARVATLLGICYVRLGRDDDAISLLMPLSKTQPDNADLKWALGSALIHSGRAQATLEQVEKVAEQKQSAEAYTLAAESFLTLTSFDRARRDAEAAIRINPHLPRPYIVIGVIDQRTGDEKGSQAAFENALQADPNYFQAHYYLGALLYTERQLKDAQAHLTRAVELKPGSSLARYDLARVERAQGNVQAALKEFETVEREEPEWLKPHVELAAFYFLLKRPQDGDREQKIVDRLSAEEQQHKAMMPVIIPATPSP